LDNYKTFELGSGIFRIAFHPFQKVTSCPKWQIEKGTLRIANLQTFEGRIPDGAWSGEVVNYVVWPRSAFCCAKQNVNERRWLLSLCRMQGRHHRPNYNHSENRKFLSTQFWKNDEHQRQSQNERRNHPHCR